MGYSVITEKSGFLITGNSLFPGEFLTFGSVVTVVNRIDAFKLNIAYETFTSTDDRVQLAAIVKNSLKASGFDDMLSHLISQQVSDVHHSEAFGSSAVLPEMIIDNLNNLSARGRSLCMLLSLGDTSFGSVDRSTVGTSLSQPFLDSLDIVDRLLHSVKLSCSFIIENGLIKPIYDVPDLNSLLLLDCVFCAHNEIQVVECENCGRFFLPTTRSDEKYCPFQDDAGHKCRKVGFENKIKNSPLEMMCRKINKTQNMRKNRELKSTDEFIHDQAECDIRSEKIKKQYRNWLLFSRNQKLRCERGEISIDDFESMISTDDWLSGFRHNDKITPTDKG